MLTHSKNQVLNGRSTAMAMTQEVLFHEFHQRLSQLSIEAQVHNGAIDQIQKKEHSIYITQPQGTWSPVYAGAYPL